MKLTEAVIWPRKNQNQNQKKKEKKVPPLKKFIYFTSVNFMLVAARSFLCKCMCVYDFVLRRCHPGHK